MISPVDLASALIAHAVADIGLGAGGILGPVLTAYGLTLNVTANAGDEGELVGLRYGELPDPPDGVSIEFGPGSFTQERDGVPNMARRDFILPIRVLLKDYPDNPISGKVGKNARFMTDIASAVMELFGPTSLGAANGGWSVTDTELLLNPMVEEAETATEEIRAQVGIVADLVFSGYKIYQL